MKAYGELVRDLDSEAAVFAGLSEVDCPISITSRYG